jgi:hypothetical protein
LTSIQDWVEFHRIQNEWPRFRKPFVKVKLLF